MKGDTAKVGGGLEYSIFFGCRENGMAGIAMKARIDWGVFGCDQEEKVFECLGVPWVAEGRGRSGLEAAVLIGGCTLAPWQIRDCG